MAEYKASSSSNIVSIVKGLPSLACMKLNSILNAIELVGGFIWYHCGIMEGINDYLGWNCRSASSFFGLVDFGFLNWLVRLVSFLFWCMGKLDHPPSTYSLRFRVSGAVVWGSEVFFRFLVSVGDFSCFSFFLGTLRCLPSFLGFLLIVVGLGLGWVEPSLFQNTLPLSSHVQCALSGFLGGEISFSLIYQ
jgi:hypothetical protein